MRDDQGFSLYATLGVAPASLGVESNYCSLRVLRGEAVLFLGGLRGEAVIFLCALCVLGGEAFPVCSRLSAAR